MATASKKKTTRKPAKKKAVRKTSKKKAPARKKVAKKAASQKKAPAGNIEKISGSVKKLMLANLGLYGKVLDELQSQASRASSAIKAARKDPSNVNKQLVKRGEALADQITDMLKRSGAPASRQLDKQMADLKKAIAALKRTIKE